MKILYLDKDEDKTSVLREKLSMDGLIIERLENVSQAIRALLTSRYDLVISDIFLDELDGYDLLKLMKKFDLKHPVVFYTHKDDELEKALAINEGAFTLIKKGNSTELNEVIEQLTLAV
ncbi:MAG: response regulator [Flavobacteriales bacterium]|nr:response regulator [Flavobacteriales bacterium]